MSNNEIEQELEECQQFYKELLMINQFFEQPYGIPSPEFCFSRLTYPLAVHLSQSKYFWKDIENFCLGHKFLFEFIKEFYDFFVTNIPPSFE